MASGSWFMAHGSRAAAPSPPWAMSHEPLTINNRLIDELFDFRLWVLCISNISKFHNFRSFKVLKFSIFKDVKLLKFLEVSKFQTLKRFKVSKFKILQFSTIYCTFSKIAAHTSSFFVFLQIARFSNWRKQYFLKHDLGSSCICKIFLQ